MSHKKRKRDLKRPATVRQVAQPEFASEMLDARIAEMLELGDVSFAEATAELAAILEEVDPFALVSGVAFHTSIHTPQDTGEWGDLNHIFQFQVEFLQAAALQRPGSEGPP